MVGFLVSEANEFLAGSCVQSIKVVRALWAL